MIRVYWTMFFLVSTSVAFVLISVALTEFCAGFECFFDVIDSAAEFDYFTVSPSAVYNGVLWSRAARGLVLMQINGLVAQTSSAGSLRLSVQLSNVPLVNRSWWERKAVHSIFKLINHLSLTECALQWRHGTLLSPKSAENLRQLWKLARSCENCGVSLTLR